MTDKIAEILGLPSLSQSPQRIDIKTSITAQVVGISISFFIEKKTTTLVLLLLSSSSFAMSCRCTEKIPAAPAVWLLGSSMQY